MEIRVVRIASKDTYVIGKLFINGVFFCHTLEPSVSASRPKGCIPVGSYRLEVTWSPKFKTDLPLLLGVPNFEGIRIHSGNTYKDTEGCLLVGDNLEVGKVLNSRNRLVELIRLIRKNNIHCIKIE